MIKHIAMFKFGGFATNEEKENYFQRLRNAFCGLENRIPELHSIHIGFDVLHSDASFDFIVSAEIENLEHLQCYSQHPAHLAAAAVIKEKAIDRKAIDYIL
ncbi:MAG: Dabb family protein [Marinifilaceae bacterium]